MHYHSNVLAELPLGGTIIDNLKEQWVNTRLSHVRVGDVVAVVMNVRRDYSSADGHRYSYDVPEWGWEQVESVSTRIADREPECWYGDNGLVGSSSPSVMRLFVSRNQDFVDYVVDYYSPEYFADDIPWAMTRDVVIAASEALRALPVFLGEGGDSFDRELVRDYVRAVNGEPVGTLEYGRCIADVLGVPFVASVAVA